MLIKKITVLFFFALLIFGGTLPLNANSDLSLEEKYQQVTVYIFLLEDCIISQNYTLLLKQLHEEYSSEQISFVGIFPNVWSTDSTIKVFNDKYQLPFELKKDEEKAMALKFAARVTPEVFVYSHTADEVLYKGRIDDLYFQVGKRKRKATTAELQDALEAVKTFVPIEVKETESIGCAINYKK